MSDDVEREYTLNGPEEIVTFVLFWALALVVFAQFFTRYVLNDSVTWTEEAARYLLIVLTFAGCGIAVRRNSHIFVEMLYRYLAPRSANSLGLAVDIARIAGFGYLAWLCVQLAQRMGFQRMNLIELPVTVIYWAVAAGLATATLRSVQVFARHLRQGHPLARLRDI